MKQRISLLALFASLYFSPAAFCAPLDLPYPVTDGKLEVTSTEHVVDLSQASTGAWDQPGQTPGKGVYDPVKWAVVFKYDSVSIAEGSTVRFLNHPSCAPVVWIVSGL